MSPQCDGLCARLGECSGPIVRVHVQHAGKDWGYFWYCQAAIAIDLERGMAVGLLPPTPADTPPAQSPEAIKAERDNLRRLIARGVWGEHRELYGGWRIGQLPRAVAGLIRDCHRQYAKQPDDPA